MKYVKYNRFWWKYDARTPLKKATIFHEWDDIKLYNVDISELEVIDVDKKSDLNWKGTDVYDNKFKTGWLDREGNFYGCEWAYHLLQAIYIHNEDSLTLEELGWVHISRITRVDTGKLEAYFSGNYKEGIMPTDKQMEYLLTRNDVLYVNVAYAYENGDRNKAKLYEKNIKNKQLIKIDENAFIE